jgi:hypothetical protein
MEAARRRRQVAINYDDKRQRREKMICEKRICQASGRRSRRQTDSHTDGQERKRERHEMAQTPLCQGARQVWGGRRAGRFL